jgi:hypothetical protein
MRNASCACCWGSNARSPRWHTDPGAWSLPRAQGGSASLLTTCGTEGQWGRRQRRRTPLRWGLARRAPGARQWGAPSAECHRGGHAFWGPTSPSQAC